MGIQIVANHESKMGHNSVKILPMIFNQVKIMLLPGQIIYFPSESIRIGIYKIVT